MGQRVTHIWYFFVGAIYFWMIQQLIKRHALSKAEMYTNSLLLKSTKIKILHEKLQNILIYVVCRVKKIVTNLYQSALSNPD